MQRIVLTAALSFFLTACSGSGGPDGEECPENFRLEGSSCVPIFDECTGPLEIPTIGGGCRSVGVQQCASGFVSDGQGGCDPVLPDDLCPPGTMPVLGQTTCQPVGITQCAAEFVSDGQGGCDPILPQNPCPDDTIEVLGETECQPLGDCGTGTWGNITVDATTLYVDASYPGSDSDGSDASPFVTLADALSIVEPWGQIAVAAGQYEERLVISRPVHIEGRCAAQVTIRGTYFLGQARPPVRITAGASGTTLKGVTVSGDAQGLLVNQARGIHIEEVQVLDLGSYGVWVSESAEATLHRVRVARCAAVGVFVQSAEVELSDSVVRDGEHFASDRPGRGVSAQCYPDGNCGTVRVERCLIDSNRDTGIYLMGGSGVVTSSVVRNTLPRQSDGMFGRGISVDCSPEGFCGSLTVQDSVIAANRDVGVIANGVDLAISSTVVRDTESREQGRVMGRGINVQCVSAGCGTVTVENSLVEGNRDLGMSITARDATIVSTIVRDTRPEEHDGTGGIGIGAICDYGSETCPVVHIEGCLLENNTDQGIVAIGVDATVTSTVVRDTQPRELDGAHGRGLEISCDRTIGRCGSLAVSRSLFLRNRQVGILTSGVDTVVSSTVVRDTQPEEGTGFNGRGITGQCDYRVGVCSTLTVDSSVVEGSHEVGITSNGIHLIVTSTVVRDTVAQLADGQYGRAINAQCDQRTTQCGSLNVSNSTVRSSESIAVFATGVTAFLDSVAVMDTRSTETGPFAGQRGYGVYAMCDSAGPCGRLIMTGCLVRSSETLGVGVNGVPGSMLDSRIESVASQPADNAFGYGVQVEAVDGQALPVFDVTACQILDAALAGILFHGGGGNVTASEIRGGPYSIAATVGSAPELADDNLLSGTTQDDLFWGNMDPSPASEPLLPVDLE